MAKNITEIDENLAVQTNLSENDLDFFNIKSEPFDVYGLYDYKNQPEFRRLPQDAAEKTSDDVAALALHTAGGRVRFSTDSGHIAIKAKMSGITRFSHMPLSGTSGFDMYTDSDDKSVYCGTFMPPVGMQGGYEQIFYFNPEEKPQIRQITINFPLYNVVEDLYIGISKSAILGHGAKYKIQNPVLYYGSSITQGGCASRPGNSYQAVISRHLNCDYINLGFSGSARGEDAIADYIAKQNMSAFVCDYDYNAPSITHLEATHEKLFKKVRASNPALPIILISAPNPEYRNESKIRSDIICKTYENAKTAGDGNVYFINGAELFGTNDRDSCTVDRTHPNDLGFLRMADVIGKVLEKVLK